MTNKFCRLLTNGYSFRLSENNLQLKPCCWYKFPIKFDQDYIINRQKQFESINDWTPGCYQCNHQEKSNIPSLRQSGPDWIAEDSASDAVMLDIFLDNECNAACVTCNENSSSLWAKENSKQHNITYIKNLNNIDLHIKNIVDNVSLEKVTYVKFFGGEPLFTDTHLKFLEHIPNPATVTIHYTTNGSIYPNKETLAMWDKFKLVIFAASLDGVEEQFDYVRWPLPWDKVSNNLLRIKSEGPYNLMFRVEFTANLLNTYYYDRLEQWINDHLITNRLGDVTDVNIHKCVGGTWDIDKMPAGCRNLILEKYHELHHIHQLVSTLPPAGSLVQWKNFIKTWDSRRGNNWKTAFPDLVEYFDHE